MARRKLFNGIIGFLAVVASLGSASGDEVLYRYEGDVLPYDPSAGWDLYNACDGGCSESLEDGHFLLYWDPFGNLVNYNLWIAQPPELPPETLWVEWRFRSDTLFSLTTTCDGNVTVRYAGILEVIYMFGDAVFSQSGSGSVLGLDSSEFHTFRFASPDGLNFRVAVDGQIFIDSAENHANGYHYLQFGGEGGCIFEDLPTLNEWDFVRYGTISSGEQIIASDPPAGNLDPQIYASLDRFTVTFDAPNYVYLDDITVEVTGGTAPTVTQTRRLDNGEPDVVEIVLDGSLPLNEMTRFTFDDGERVNVVAYTLGELPPIPAVSQWGIVVMTLLVLTAGTLILVRRFLQARWDW